MKGKHRDLSKLTATDLIEAELEAMRELGIAPENWASVVFGSATESDQSRIRIGKVMSK